MFYALRPGFVRSQRPTCWHFVSIFIQLFFDYFLVAFVPGGKHMLIYLVMSSFCAGSLHPLAGHFIAEHYIWDGLQQETYSYYGWLNIFAYNVSSSFSHLRSRKCSDTLFRSDITMNTTTFHLYHGRACLLCVLSHRSSMTTCPPIHHGL